MVQTWGVARRLICAACIGLGATGCAVVPGPDYGYGYGYGGGVALAPPVSLQLDLGYRSGHGWHGPYRGRGWGHRYER